MDFGADVGWAKDQPLGSCRFGGDDSGKLGSVAPGGPGFEATLRDSAAARPSGSGRIRLPVSVYRRGWGGLMGHTFLVVDHAGRKTGLPHFTVAMVLSHDLRTNETVICSALGVRTPTGSGTSEPARRCRFTLDEIRSRPDSISLSRMRAWLYWRSSAPAPWEVAPHYIDPGLVPSSSAARTSPTNDQRYTSQIHIAGQIIQIVVLSIK